MNHLVGEFHAVVATTRKELRLMRRYPMEVASLAIWMILYPLAYVAQAKAFSAGAPGAVSAFANRAGTDDVVTFLYLGWSVYLLITAVLLGPGLALQQERSRGSFEVLFASPTSRFTILFGSAPAQVVPFLVVFGSAAASMRLLFGTHLDVAGIMRWLGILLIAFPMLMALGALFATAVLSLEDAAGAMHVCRGVAILLCGVAFPVAVLPRGLQSLSAALPPTHLLEVLRETVPVSGSLRAELPWLLLLVGETLPIGIAAMTLFWLSAKYARRTGKLGRF